MISSRDFSESHPPVACGEKSPRDHVIELREISYYKEGRSMSISNYIRSFEIKFVESTLTRILYRLMYVKKSNEKIVYIKLKKKLCCHIHIYIKMY